MGVGPFFFVAPRGAGRRARAWRCLLCPASVFWPWGSVARALSALILCQTLCRLRGRCGTARARAALWDAVGRRARSRLEAWTRSFSVIGLACLWWCEASCLCAWSSTRVVGVRRIECCESKGLPWARGAVSRFYSPMTSAFARPSSCRDLNTGGVSASVTATEERSRRLLCRVAIAGQALPSQRSLLHPKWWPHK